MNRFRTATVCLFLGALIVTCEYAPEQGSRVLASIGLDASGNSGNGAKQGTITRRIGPGPMFAPFPDGTRMAIMHWATADLSSYDLETGETTRITGQPDRQGQQSGTAMNPVLSSDGTRVAYTWNDFTQYPGELQLRVRDLNGGEPRQLYTQPGGGWFNPVDWSDDGRRLLVLRTLQEGSAPGSSQIISVSTDDGDVTVLKRLEEGDYWPARVLFSPDGRSVAFDNPTAEDESDRDIFVLPSEGGGVTALVEGHGTDRLMGWAPDGRSVLFLSDRGGTPGAWLQPVADGRAVGDPHLIKADLWNVVSLNGFDREGRYYYQVRVGARALNEVTLSADGRSVASEAADLTSREYAWLHLGRWSPDGRHIAMTIPRNGRGPWGDVLLVRSADSGEEREVRGDGGDFNDLAWMPDGQSVIASVIGYGRQTSLVEIDVRTGEAVVLMELGHSHLSSVAVSPDGGTVYYTQQDYSQLEHVLQEGVATERIMALELATGATRVVHQSDPGSPTMGSGLAISPDGTMLAFGFIPRQQPSGTIDERRLYVIATGGGAPRMVGDAWYSTCTWTSNGDGLLCFRPFAGEVRGNPQGRLVRVDVKTGEVTPLGLEGDSYGIRGCLSLHPNGRRLLFAAGEPTSEWWVMEGFLASR